MDNQETGAEVKELQWICNTTLEDMAKICRLKAGVKVGPAQATPGFTARENQEAGLVGVYGNL